MLRQIMRGIAPACLALLGAGAPVAARNRQPPPFTVTGTVLDTQGRPLAGASVRLNADFVYGRAEVTTGVNGRYAISDLIRATYRATAFIERPYAGGTVCQQLAMPSPSDYNSFAVSQGAVRNFRWQLTGRMGVTDTYFGAAIMLWFEGDTRDGARAVEFTLTPTGPLFDGSRGEPLVREAVLRYPASNDGLVDVPLGTYTMKAVLIGKDGRRAALNMTTREQSEPAPEVSVVWDPARFCGLTGSGVDPFFVQVSRAR